MPYEGDSIGKIAIPPHDIYVSDTKPPGPAVNRYTGEVLDIVLLGSIARVKISVGGKELLAEMPADALDEMSLHAGQQVYVIIKLRRLRYFQTADRNPA